MTVTTLALIALIIYFATFTQAVTGFGLALVSMPLLVPLVGIAIAAPLVAVIGFASQVVLALRYRQKITFGSIKELAIGSVLGIPLGVFLPQLVSENVVVALLGVFILSYAIYALVTPQLPTIERPAWGYGLGFVAGIITGAYNSGGPPLVIYGNCARWEPDVFKGNIQTLLVIHSITVLVAHGLNGNYTAIVLESFLIAVPAIALGTLSGLWLDRYINKVVFHRIVLSLLIILGLRLLQVSLL